MILNAFLQKVELLKEDIHYGQPIAKKLIPAEWISPEGNMVKDEAIAYILPLIQGEAQVSYANGLPVHFKFDKNARV
jgi:hypothetical protein